MCTHGIMWRDSPFRFASLHLKEYMPIRDSAQSEVDRRDVMEDRRARQIRAYLVADL
jgi:hypothetical protein